MATTTLQENDNVKIDKVVEKALPAGIDGNIDDTLTAAPTNNLLEEADTRQESSGILEVVKIHPPGLTSQVVLLHQVSVSESVMTLKYLLMELPELACHTCFSLQVQDNDNTDDDDVPESSSSWTTLNDFYALMDYPALLAGNTCRMVQERYDFKKAHTHVRRLRDVLANPLPPSLQAVLVNMEEVMSMTTPTAAATTTTNACDASTESQSPVKPLLSNANANANANTVTPQPEKEQAAESAQTEDSKAEVLAAHKLQMKQLHDTIPLMTFSSSDLSTFYPEKDNRPAHVPSCVKSITFSGYNPPPGPAKLAGDLFYLDIKTSDEQMFVVTAHVTGFYVNKTTRSVFDPTRAKHAHSDDLLVNVLIGMSSSFRSGYAALLQHGKNSQLSMEQLLLSGSLSSHFAWNVPSTDHTTSSPSNASHAYDLNRAEIELTHGFGMEARGELRDWNEEYQSTRELPAVTEQDKILRNRLIFKVLSEFNTAAVAGVKAIMEGHITPMNPLERPTTHVYVYNNIFFSQSVDASSQEVDDETNPIIPGEFASANHDVQGVRAYNSADTPGLYTLATCVVDYLGLRLIAQSIIPGILQTQALSKLVYGSVDEGVTIASNPTMHALMVAAGKTLCFATRTVQPSGSTTTTDTLTPTDTSMDRKNDLFQEASEASTEPVELCGPVEAKGILGTDGRHYILDLVRVTPVDTTYYDTLASMTVVPEADADRDTTPQPSSPSNHSRAREYTALLRPELIELFRRVKIQEATDAAKKEATHEKVEKVVGVTQEKDTSSLLVDAPFIESMNLNVFQKNYSACVDPVVAAADEALVRSAASYLQQTVIPAQLQEWRAGTSLDGVALTESMHTNGINLRYLGMMASQFVAWESSSEERVSRSMLELLEIEMIARALKPILSDKFKSFPELRAMPGATYLSLLNAVFGGLANGPPSTTSPASRHNTSLDNNSHQSLTSGQKKKKKKKKKSLSSASSSNVASFFSDSVWRDIQSTISRHFHYDLVLWSEAARQEEHGRSNAQEDGISLDTDEYSSRRLLLPLLRRVCQQLGVRVVSKSYAFHTTTPFVTADVMELVPRVKSSLPKHPSAAAKYALDLGRVYLHGQALPQAYSALSQAATLIVATVGSVAHVDAAACQASLAMLFYRAGEMSEALAHQQRALGLYTELLGACHYTTVSAQVNLALFLYVSQDLIGAATHMGRAIYLMILVGGAHGAEVSSMVAKLGDIYQTVGRTSLALTCYERSLRMAPCDLAQLANTHHQMASCFALAGNYRQALAVEKKAQVFFIALYGDTQGPMAEVARCIAIYTTLAVKCAKNDRQKQIQMASLEKISNVTPLTPAMAALSVKQDHPTSFPVEDGFIEIVAARKKGKKQTTV